MLQLFTMIIKQKIFTKFIKKVKLDDIGDRTKWSNYKRQEAQAL